MYSFSLSLTLLSGFIGLGRPLVHTIHPDFDFTFLLITTMLWKGRLVWLVGRNGKQPHNHPTNLLTIAWLWISTSSKRKTKSSSSRGHHLQEEYARTGLDNSENILIFKIFALQQLFCRYNNSNSNINNNKCYSNNK